MSIQMLISISWRIREVNAVISGVLNAYVWMLGILVPLEKVYRYILFIATCATLALPIFVFWGEGGIR